MITEVGICHHGSHLWHGRLRIQNGNQSIGLSLPRFCKFLSSLYNRLHSKGQNHRSFCAPDGSQDLLKFACCSFLLFGGPAIAVSPPQTPIAKSTRRVKTYHPSCVYLFHPYPSKEKKIFPSSHKSNSDFVELNKFGECLSRRGCSFTSCPGHTCSGSR